MQLLKLPYNILFPLIILFTIIGVYCSSNNVFDVYVMIAFGAIGYFMRKLGYEPAPLVLAFVLGPMLENNLRKSLILSQGDLPHLRQSPDRRPAWRWRWLLVGPLLPSREARTGGAGRACQSSWRARTGRSRFVACTVSMALSAAASSAAGIAVQRLKLYPFNRVETGDERVSLADGFDRNGLAVQLDAERRLQGVSEFDRRSSQYRCATCRQSQSTSKVPPSRIARQARNRFPIPRLAAFTRRAASPDPRTGPP